MLDERSAFDHAARAAIRWWLYPALWLWTAACVAYGLAHPDALRAATALKGGVSVGLLLLLEWRFPYQRRWGMTWRHLLRRDLPFFAVNGATLGLLNYLPVLLAIELAPRATGPLTGRPLWLQVGVGLLVFEVLQYSLHRAMHESRGPLTRHLWRAHAIHHLPQQLYVVMHGVFHPLNAVLVRGLVQLLPVWLLGYDPAAVFVFGAVIALHGLVSHLNLDMRLGWLNYVFVGPELHRYHHSAACHEAQNYGAALSLLDLLGGTFRYRPGVPPAELGLREADGYPGQHDPLGALAFAFSTRPVEPPG